MHGAARVTLLLMLLLLLLLLLSDVVGLLLLRRVGWRWVSAGFEQEDHVLMYFVVSEGGSGSFVMALDKPGNPDGGTAYFEIDSPILANSTFNTEFRDDNRPDCAFRRLTCSLSCTYTHHLRLPFVSNSMLSE